MSLLITHLLLLGCDFFKRDKMILKFELDIEQQPIMLQESIENLRYKCSVGLKS